MSNPSESGLAPVNGLEMYYERHGSGVPLILLHGGAAPEWFGANVSEFARDRQVIVVHLQGHGRTRDIDRPLCFESMADDIAALISHLNLDQADVMGYSLGSGVALQTAIRHPDAVGKLVVASFPMTQDGWYPEVRANYDAMAADPSQAAAGMKQSPMGAAYPDTDWSSLFQKLGDLLSRDYDWSAQVASLTTPTMLLFADADAVGPDYIVRFYKQLGGGQRDATFDGSLRSPVRLAIVPGATHYDLFTTTMPAQLVAPFLAAQLKPETTH